MQLEMEILEDGNYKSILKTEVCRRNHKTIDWFPHDKCPPNKP